MFEFINFKDEAVALTKWLISIPSITSTQGEQDISKAIYDTLCSISYFRGHQNNVLFVPHADQKHHSVVALVRVEERSVRQTLCVMCSCDTSGNDTYAMLKPLAFKSDDLKEKLKEIIKNRSKSAPLTYDNTLYGLGSFECKAAAGALLTMVKEASDTLADLPFNLLFVCTSQNIAGNAGMRECLPYIYSLLNENDLDLTLTVGFKPDVNAVDENALKLYTSNMGRTAPCFYIMGKGASPREPFKGFSPTQVAARIVEKLELNARLTAELSDDPIVPIFRSILMPHSYSRRTSDSCLLSFELPFQNFNLPDLFEILKKVAAEALEESCLALENRQNYYLNTLDQEFEPELRDAEVLSYSDLFYRASRHYRGDLHTAIGGLIARCRKKEYSDEEILNAVIERLNDLARLPRPSVILCLGPDFVPRQQLRRNNAEDREVYMRLNEAVEDFNAEHVQQISFEENAEASDCCFMRPVGVDAAQQFLKAECPLRVHDFYNLGAPAVTLSIKGADLNLPTEHVSTEIFDIIPAFLIRLFERFKDKTVTAAPAAQDEESVDEELESEELAEDEESEGGKNA